MIEVIGSMNELDATQWDALTDGSPLLSYAFLSALEDSGCVGDGTGWQAYPLLAREDGMLVGAIPLFVKGHSYGEYVFDWSWADAYERNGIPYYPKLLAAVPFTPITGARLLSADNAIQHRMVQVLAELVQRNKLSSAHVLFPDDDSAVILQQEGWLERHGVQFLWENEAYTTFEDFIGQLSHDKRKKIRQERKKVNAAGVTCRKIRGADITESDWDFFFRCYQNTYREHRSTPYLTREFFSTLNQRMPQNVLLIIAAKEGRDMAAAFNVVGRDALYGRYWGALEFVSGLHFELCYYQAQEFCIEQKLRYFEGGAQGEHKLARGFLPRPTRSFHHIAHPEFASAIRNFLNHEANGIQTYQNELEERVPYKKIL